MDGPPPLPPPSPNAPPGWHDDPDDPTSLRYWDGSRWTDQRAPKPKSDETSSQRADWDNERIAAAVGAAGIIVGSLGPWATASSAFGSMSMSGTEGDGVITLVGGGVVLLTIILRKYLVAWIIAVITGAVVAYDWSNLSRVVDENDSDFINTSVGWGLYVAGIGAIVAFASSIQIWQRERLQTAE